MLDVILEFEKDFQRKQYKVRERYKIQGYPHNIDTILSEDGFGYDDHIPLTKNLILVNLFGVILLIASWIGFAGLANAIHPGSMNFSFSSTNDSKLPKLMPQI